LVDVGLHNIRDWSKSKHNQVDDRPFGGGAGMVLMAPIVVECVEAVQAASDEPGHLVMLTPQGQRLNQATVERLATHKRLVLLCGRYEGFDERIRQILQPEEISLGDFVLNGGEVAAMAIVDAVIRLVPGVLGDEDSSVSDSFSGERRWLEFPQYTRPREYRGWEVPEILLSGNHQGIARWREAESLKRTQQRRPDLLE
jgi:tRNA (guanine37-N1)-methyltransferase